MDSTTQQNASLVEESASAAASLKEQANLLLQAVSVFSLGAQIRPAEVSPFAPVVCSVAAKNKTEMENVGWTHF